MVNFVPAVAYHFCLTLPAAFAQPVAHLLAKPGTSTELRKFFAKLREERPRQAKDFSQLCCTPINCLCACTSCLYLLSRPYASSRKRFSQPPDCNYSSGTGYRAIVARPSTAFHLPCYSSDWSSFQLFSCLTSPILSFKF